MLFVFILVGFLVGVCWVDFFEVVEGLMVVVLIFSVLDKKFVVVVCGFLVDVL